MSRALINAMPDGGLLVILVVVPVATALTGLAALRRWSPWWRTSSARTPRGS